MSDEVEKYDEFGDLSLSMGKDEDSNLDEYGVWIKKKPSTEEGQAHDELSSNSMKSESITEDDVPFDFDGLDESASLSTDNGDNDLTEVDFSSEEISQPDFSDEHSQDSNFDDIDVSNFFTDLESTAESEEVIKKEDEEALKMDLNFDNVDSYMQEENTDDFDSMVSELDSSSNSDDSKPSDTSEFDDILSDINSSSYPSKNSTAEQSNVKNMDINVDVDESQDFSNIGHASDSQESVILPTPVFETAERPEEKREEDFVVKNIVVEPENIEEIREENRKVMGSESSKTKGDSLSDIEALANDLTSDSPTNNNSTLKPYSLISVEGIDKITDLLTEIVKELSSVKNEISMLKQSSQFEDESAKSFEKKNVELEDGTGFFKDEDTDEAIALTGDELNNILITADFTEEGEHTENSEDVGTCESCSDEEKEAIEDDFSSEKDVDFDDIALENSKLDDFVIPEELDYNMLNNENEEAFSTEGSDMSYLDEKEAGDELSIDVPETQDIAIEKDSDADSNLKTSEGLSSDTKQKVKSVLAYMDQLLESLPEDKMKEFAESEYFEMYNGLFNELGIS